MIVHFQSGHLSEEDGIQSGDSLEKNAVLVYPGKFQSMDGEVEVTPEQLSALVKNHNSLFEKFKRLALGDVPMRDMPPIQLDHEPKATHTVGRLVGPLSMGDIDIDGEKKSAVLGKVRILGKENVEKVKDGRWIHLSIGADLEEGKLNELTITPFPAAEHAAMLSKAKLASGFFEYKGKKFKWENIPSEGVIWVWDESGKEIHEAANAKEALEWVKKEVDSGRLVAGDTPQDPEKEGMPSILSNSNKGEKMGLFSKKEKLTAGEGHTSIIGEESHSGGAKEGHTSIIATLKQKMEMYEKCKKKMLGEGKSEEEADKHLSEMPEEDAKKMAAEVDENEKKMSAEKEKEDEKKMSRLAKVKALETKLSANLTSVKLAQIQARLTVRLSSLRAAGKITPAEFKKLDLMGMAKLSEEAREAALKTYDLRQPVIDPRVYGSAEGVSYAELQKKANDKKLEAEARLSMPSVNPGKVELAAGMDEHTASIHEQVKKEMEGPSHENKVSGDAMAKHLAAMEKIKMCMEEGKHDEAMKHLCDHMASIKAGGDIGEEHHVAQHEAEKHLSALADAEKSLENTLNETQQLLAEFVA